MSQTLQSWGENADARKHVSPRTMKTKTTLLLLTAVVALGLYIKFYESKGPNTVEAREQGQKMVKFDREKLDGIVIQNGDDKIELRRQDRKWRIENPFKDQADSGAIESFLADLEAWPKFDTIPAKEIGKDQSRIDEFGLSKAKLRLKLLGKDVPSEIVFGGDAAFEGKMYVRFADTNDVFLAGLSVRNDISKKPEEFRDKKLTDLTTAQVTRALLKTAAGEMELEKKADHWEIVKPLRARGDDQKIGDLLAQVTTARIEQFVAEDRGDLHPYGLAEPRGSITLFTAEDKSAGSPSGRAESGQLLQIGGVSEKAKDQIYVRFAARNAVYTLPKKIEEILGTKPADLRDRHLVRLDPDILDRITIEAVGQGKTVLARKAENWTIASRSNQPANAGEVNRLIELLKAEQVTKFVEDVASDLPKYGLDKPQLQVTFSSFASENTAETTAGEHPFATIAFGKTDGDNIYARLGDEPFIVAVRRTLLDKIFIDPLQWQELVIFKLKPDEVHKLSIVTDHESVLVRNANRKEWTWAKGNEPINQTNVQSLLNTLTVLHAVRWAGATTPAHAFEKPQITITFTTSPDDKATHKLVVGGAAGNGMWFARTDEREGTFVLNNPDLTALRLPLVATPSPATPAVSASTTPVGTPASSMVSPSP